MSAPPGMTAWKLSYQLSPIILTGGVASLIPGGMLPIISILQAGNFLTGLLSGNTGVDNLDGYFAHFYPAPGGKLISVLSGEYTFANAQVAANAVVLQPNVISLIMDCPAQGEGSYLLKVAIFTALEATLRNHVAQGGLFTVMTPAFPYTDAILIDLTDISSPPSQPQSKWQWSFRTPLVTQSAAQAAQNTLMSKLGSGLPTTGATSGVDLTVGATNTLATGAVSPAASNTAGTALAGNVSQFGVGGGIPV